MGIAALADKQAALPPLLHIVGALLVAMHGIERLDAIQSLCHKPIQHGGKILRQGKLWVRPNSLAPSFVDERDGILLAQAVALYKPRSAPV